MLGLGLRVEGLGFRVEGLGFRIQALGFSVKGLGFRVCRPIEGMGLVSVPFSNRGFQIWC